MLPASARLHDTGPSRGGARSVPPRRAGLRFGDVRLFRYSGKKANNPEGFEEALSGFLLSEE